MNTTAFNSGTLSRLGASSLLAFAVLAAGMVPAVPALAGDNDMEIERIKDKTRNSVVLVLDSDDDDLEKERVDIKVKVRNKRTGATMTKKFNATLSKDGGEKVTVAGLQPNTEYSFKAKIRKDGREKYSDYSDSESATTR